jgi:hypothetical protein
MYERLKELCSTRGLNITQLCKDVTNSSGNLSTWKKGYMRSDYLSLVADKLQCSTDYLLGRVDQPQTVYSINGNNNVQVNGNNGDHSPLTVNSSDNDDTTAELVELVQSLPLVKRAEAILYLNQLKNEGI